MNNSAAGHQTQSPSNRIGQLRDDMPTTKAQTAQYPVSPVPLLNLERVGPGAGGESRSKAYATSQHMEFTVSSPPKAAIGERRHAGSPTHQGHTKSDPRSRRATSLEPTHEAQFIRGRHQRERPIQVTSSKDLKVGVQDSVENTSSKDLKAQTLSPGSFNFITPRDPGLPEGGSAQNFKAALGGLIKVFEHNHRPMTPPRSPTLNGKTDRREQSVPSEFSPRGRPNYVIGELDALRPARVSGSPHPHQEARTPTGPGV
eukprot:CAMPEP_0184308720 /NCGR_PEP_ID=MMETSP1049-20130417/17095_1 /TAXON_ID=77928 /ORGANISM="Proteomonas sulcata, Strain CCMP704" /LENGTH=257 /DNA_ID=CAMNT_0026621455 /DNA_START=32 /DNA_END=805 /DNA_ORIENTATION=-